MMLLSLIFFYVVRVTEKSPAKGSRIKGSRKKRGKKKVTKIKDLNGNLYRFEVRHDFHVEVSNASKSNHTIEIGNN